MIPSADALFIYKNLIKNTWIQKYESEHNQL